MSRVRRYSRSGLTAPHPRSPTGLSPPTVTRSSGLRLTDAGPARRLPPPPAHSFNPPLASPAGCAASGVWAPPRSLAATKGILSVPRGTEMFQFPRCPPRSPWVPGRAPGGLPHSEIPGSQAASASPGHFAAWPRPSSAANAKASTMRPSCGCPAPRPPGSRRRHDRRPARASGTVPVRRRRLPAAPRLRCPGERGCVSLSCVLRISARGRADTSPRKDVAVSRGRRTPRVPRGALSRCIKTRRSARSANLVRRRPPPSDELSQPARGQSTTAGVTKGTRPAAPPVEPRGFEPRTSAVQGRRSPS